MWTKSGSRRCTTTSLAKPGSRVSSLKTRPAARVSPQSPLQETWCRATSPCSCALAECSPANNKECRMKGDMRPIGGAAPHMAACCLCPADRPNRPGLCGGIRRPKNSALGFAQRQGGYFILRGPGRGGKQPPFEKRAFRFPQRPAPIIRDLVAIVSVVDCSEAAWPFEGFWRDGLEDASQREGFTIYGDWEGEMRAAFEFPRGGASFALLGPDGKALYVWPGTLPRSAPGNMRPSSRP